MAVSARKVHTFSKIWTDSGSGGDHDGAFFRPEVLAGWHSLGDSGVPGYDAPAQATLLVKAGSDPDALKHPTKFVQIWDDSGSGASKNASFWRPIPPAGYVAMGTVCLGSHGEAPSVNSVMCVKEEYTELGDKGDFIWNNNDTGTHKDFAAWQIVPHAGTGLRSGTFYSCEGRNLNTKEFHDTTGHVLNSAHVKFQGGLLSAAAPEEQTPAQKEQTPAQQC